MTDLEELKKQLSKTCGRTTGHGEHCGPGWECSACAENKKALAAIESLQRELEEARRDADLFTWWFSDSNKGNFLLRYMEGMKERWSVERWRTEINAARQQKG